MTPTAATPAARTAASKRRPAAKSTQSRATESRSAAPKKRASSPHPSTPRAAGVRAPLRRSATPKTPRRVSGPARPATRPGRSAPTRGATAAAPRTPLGARSLAYVRALPDHSLLDRIVRGRVWIPLLGILLVGIVAMQVSVLKLNAGIGHSLQSTQALQTRNDALRAQVAQLGDDTRIERAAARMGMTMPLPANVRFLADRGASGAAGAARSITAPDAANFGQRLTQAQAAADAAAQSASASQADSAG